MTPFVDTSPVLDEVGALLLDRRYQLITIASLTKFLTTVRAKRETPCRSESAAALAKQLSQSPNADPEAVLYNTLLLIPEAIAKVIPGLLQREGLAPQRSLLWFLVREISYALDVSEARAEVLLSKLAKDAQPKNAVLHRQPELQSASANSAASP